MMNDIRKKYAELEKEAGQYNRAEFDAVYSIISKLTKDNPNVGDGGDLDCPLVEGAIIDEALRLAGYADDEDFVCDFKKYREIEQQAREVQLEGLKLQLPTQLEDNEYTPPRSGEWYFVPIRIFAPKPMQSLIEQVITNEANEGKGLFANITDIPLEDESLDDWFDVEAYGIKCSLEPIFRELQQYNIIDGVLSSKEVRVGYLTTLKELICYYKDNTDQPNKVRNHITTTLKVFDNMPIYGLILQLLLLQGFCKWLECVDINEGDNGYNEGCCMYEWLLSRLQEKEMNFCFMRFGDDDLKRLEPLCNYLYSTEMGKMIQRVIRERFYPELQGEQPQTEELPQSPSTKIQLSTEEQSVFNKAVKSGLVESVGNIYKWIGETGGKKELAYFIKRYNIVVLKKPEEIKEERPRYKTEKFEIARFQQLFGVEKISQEIQKPIRKAGYKKVDIFFSKL